ncbi:unnamed protein product [Linum trigynum]|uniref:RNase H type-1 domain-containing protein n=1 Tax=Linum trigynum TaxID=586398 RepID=A0AAV2E222_9ROSI
MNCLSRLSAYSSTIFGRSTSHFIVKGTWNQCSSPLWKRSLELSSVRTGNPKCVFPKFVTRCYSTEKPKSKAPRKRKSLEQKETDMEKDSFFVVRKGDVVGVYKTFNECQAQVGSSICDPPVSIYKGESIPDETKEYLATCGLQNAIFTIRAQDLKPDLFGTLVPWPFQQHGHFTEQIDARDGKKGTLDMMIPQVVEAGGTTLSIADPSKKAVRLDHQMATPLRSFGYEPEFCTLEFDGASRGNPGPAGAGAVLRTSDGTLICRLQEGLGTKTNNVAEYRAVLLGLRYALQRGYRNIRLQGDSKLVCSQIDGTWKVKHAGMAELCDQVKELKDRFVSFEINHVLREFNAEADVQANLAVNLREGAVQEVYE